MTCGELGMILCGYLVKAQSQLVILFATRYGSCLRNQNIFALFSVVYDGSDNAFGITST